MRRREVTFELRESRGRGMFALRSFFTRVIRHLVVFVIFSQPCLAEILRSSPLLKGSVSRPTQLCSARLSGGQRQNTELSNNVELSARLLPSFTRTGVDGGGIRSAAAEEQFRERSGETKFLNEKQRKGNARFESSRDRGRGRWVDG